MCFQNKKLKKEKLCQHGVRLEDWAAGRLEEFFKELKADSTYLEFDPANVTEGAGGSLTRVLHALLMTVRDPGRPKFFIRETAVSRGSKENEGKQNF